MCIRDRCTARRAELIEDASAELADARAEYNDKKAEADRQFADCLLYTSFRCLSQYSIWFA